MKITKIERVCERCGSNDITFDAVAVWNTRSQQFQYDIFDCYCNACGDTCDDSVIEHTKDFTNKIKVI